jgi:hypothetical protein
VEETWELELLGVADGATAAELPAGGAAVCAWVPAAMATSAVARNMRYSLSMVVASHRGLTTILPSQGWCLVRLEQSRKKGQSSVNSQGYQWLIRGHGLGRRLKGLIGLR